MKVRAIKDLTQLDDPSLFAAIAEGLNHIIKNVSRLYAGASHLSEAKLAHSSRVLATVAEEEAAKFLVLVDAIRCPRVPSDRFSRQLGRFNEHLAKGLYARACLMCPGTLKDLQRYMDNHRQEYFLDGPNDVDWIFRNEVIQGREGALYVDYISNEGDHSWSDPAAFETLYATTMEPWSVRTARHLFEVGVSSPEAVATVADVWRGQSITLETHWSEIAKINRGTLEALESRGLLADQPDDTYRFIIENWQFPMYDVNLALIPVKLEALRQQQQEWNPY